MLPDTITKYLIGHVTRNVPAAMRWYTDDAEVTDDGKTYRGRDEIRAWLARSASEYSYTTELTSTRQVDEHTYVATHHLEGNFPGGTVDWRCRFTVDGDAIHRLEIAG